jgi:hypothetical protein
LPARALGAEADALALGAPELGGALGRVSLAAG